MILSLFSWLLIWPFPAKLQQPPQLLLRSSQENYLQFVKATIEALIADNEFPANHTEFWLSPNSAFGDMGCTDNDTMIPILVSRAQSAGSCVNTCCGQSEIWVSWIV